jgi:hypothetical protein
MLDVSARSRTPWSALLFGLMLQLSACGAGWHRITPTVPSSLPKRQQVQVWQGEKRLQLHSVTLAGDSISGVPYTQNPNCDSCRVAVSRASVDSLRAGSPSSGFWKTTGLVVGGMFVVVAISCATRENVCDTD